MFPSLRGYVDLPFTHPDKHAWSNAIWCSSQPERHRHAAGAHAAGCRREGGRLAADFRLQDIAAWEKWYGMTHACPDLVAEAVYGLPEVNREKIKTARLVANPGCYPTAVQLGFIPLLEAGVIEPGSLIADANQAFPARGARRNATLFRSGNN
jgi:N-acetyl-gamma-glutamyl-phosphate reductase